MVRSTLPPFRSTLSSTTKKTQLTCKHRSKKSPSWVRRCDNVFGSQYQITFDSQYSFAPTNKVQKMKEVERLSATVVPLHRADHKLKEILYERIEEKQDFKATLMNSSVYSKIVNNFSCSSVSDVIRHMNIKELYKLLQRLEPTSQKIGMVVGFLPHSGEYFLRVGEDDTLLTVKWKDFAKFTRVETTNHGIGMAFDVPFDGPPCPKCQHPLGRGYNAWKKCVMCKLDYPGTLYSLRLNKYDPFVNKHPKQHP